MSEKLWAALIGGLSGGVVSMITTFIIQSLKIKHAIKTWNNDFAVNYSKLLVENPDAAFELSRQFSVGLLILQDAEGRTEHKYFMPAQCKVSVGREDDNDIVIEDETVSRYHGVFYYKNNTPFYRDLGPLNVTCVNGKQIRRYRRLKSGDHILLGGTRLVFQDLN